MRISQQTHNILEKYDVDYHNGFLPSDQPLNNLPPKYKLWDELNKQMPQSLKDKLFVEKILNLPIIKVEALTSGEMRRAMLLLSAFAHAFVKESKTNSIPEQVAVPWNTVANAMNQLPVITHSSLSLQNWYLKDKSKPIGPYNLGTQISFTGTKTESWFFNTTTCIEKIGAKAIPLLLESIHCANNKEYQKSAYFLKQIIPISKKLIIALRKMYEKCDPNIFYNDLRGYFDSFEDVKYMGLTPEVRSYAGGSAAQSSLLQFFDMALGISYGHTSSQEFLQDMRNYMPEAHREFLIFTEEEYNLRFARQKNEKVNDICKEIIQNLIEFRNEHLKMVGLYIVQPASLSKSRIKGTGGTSPMIFLKEVRNINMENKDEY